MGVVKVLSLDGGGIRGVIPALVLTELEQRAGKPISQLFDLIAGTSTGGILALGLTKPNGMGEPEYRAADIVDLYANEGKRIFSRSIWHKTRAVGSLLDEKYPASPIEGVLDEYFGDARLKDALTDVLVTSYEIEKRSPWFFRSRKAREDEQFDFPMKEVARATSAAPTYFEPAKLEAKGTVDYWALIDGGVYANNPTMCGIVEAKRSHGADELLVVSLGTGQLTRRLVYEEAKDWGLVGWARPVLDVVFDGVSDTVDFQAEQLCDVVEGERRYYRFQAALEIGNDDMDDASATNIHALRVLADELISTQSDDLDAVCAALTAGESAVPAGGGVRIDHPVAAGLPGEPIETPTPTTRSGDEGAT